VYEVTFTCPLTVKVRDDDDDDDDDDSSISNSAKRMDSSRNTWDSQQRIAQDHPKKAAQDLRVL
jgi:hypothetical protein